MQSIKPKNLSAASLQVLSALSQDIALEKLFTDKVYKAKSLWNSKGSSKAKLNAFYEVRNTLVAALQWRTSCAYCESNEPGDIEHIFPKSHFPDKTFEWENYLYVCKTCNTSYKSDYFAVFDPAGSDNSVELSRKKIMPPSDDSVFIHQRKENPRNYFVLNLQSSIYDIDSSLNNRDLKKADYTLDILKLNSRDHLLKGRKNAVKNYMNLLKEYISVKNSADFNELLNAVGSFPVIDTTAKFKDEKARVLDSLKKTILELPFPTVWEEMKLQKALFPGIDRLFLIAPEALIW